MPADGGLHDGLAGYWYARKTSAAADWQLQVEPIRYYGAGYVWGNDSRWFIHAIRDDIQARARRPDYRFIILDGLPDDRIIAAYGAPDRKMLCGPSRVWIYDEPGRLYRALVRASPSMADTFAAAPAGPDSSGQLARP